MDKKKCFLRNTWNSIATNRKLRCGTFSVCLSVVVIACMVLVCWAADSAERRYALALDCSYNGATSQSNVTREVLEALDKPVTIYAVVPLEGEDSTLMALLERYQANRFITVSKESILKNPVLLNRFEDELDAGQAVTDDCLIIHCPQTGRARVLTEDDYYTYSYNMETGYFEEAGFTYEKSITEAIVYVSRDELPTLQVLTGHGELTLDEMSGMTDLLISHNYLLKQVSPANGDTLDAASPLLILSPRYDLTDREIDIISSFASDGGSLFIASQYTESTELPNFNALLHSYGVTLLPGIVIAQQADTDSYYTDMPVWLMPYMQETTVTLPLLQSGKDILLLAGARGFEVNSQNNANIMAQTVLLTGQSYIRDFNDGLDTTQQQENDAQGVFPLAVWVDRMTEDGSVSHAFIIGNASMFNDFWTLNNTDSGTLLLTVLSKLQGKEALSLNIEPVNALRDAMSLGDLTPAVIVTAMLPLIVVLGAFLVLWPRRNK